MITYSVSPRRRLSLSTVLPVLPSFLLAALAISAAQAEDPELRQFPYHGGGDPDHSFAHPYVPGMTGDPVSNWVQLGTATIARAQTGRDVVRLTSASQANQGLLYNSVRTRSNNFNGYFDIQMDSVRESHEAADGMGFFFSRDAPRLGSAMGMTHTFEGLGIIIDTFSNSRTRHVPYMYAYVSDGRKEWNPDTDGKDTEVTQGCQLEMNEHIRVYVQYVDSNLHVGVAMSPRDPHRWHTCFKASNVHLPFSDGGYFSFAGETGHFFAMHEVHDAAFIDDGHYGSNNQYSNNGGQQQQQHNDQHVVDGHNYDTRKEQPAAPKYQTNPDPQSRVHVGGSSHETVSGSLDLQVYDIFNSMSSALKGMGDHDIEDTKVKLHGVRDLTAELVKEVDRQKAEMGNLISTLKHLKGSAGDLTYASDRFKTQLRGLHGSVKALRERAEEISDSNDDMHNDLHRHHEQLRQGGSNGLLIMFLVIQVILVGGVYMMNKISASTKKLGRMV